MLKITMRSGEGAIFLGELSDLFRTVQVHGEVPFIEPSAGTLLNLTHVERIYDDAAEQAATDEAEQADVTVCPHGYLRYTCSICTPAFTGIPQYRGKP